jgi:hypothetical protein
VLLLQIFRGALLGGGGLALGNGVALSYGGGHKVVTYVAWYVLAALLLAAGVVFWVEIHRRKEATGLKDRGQQPDLLAGRLDSLMREGMELLDELMAPAQAEETSEGVWALGFGDAPDEWWDKADAFYTKIKDLLTAEHPALLPDFERGYNERLRIQRETEKVAPQGPDIRSNAQKMLDFATDTQRTPAKIVEACLEGLSQARKSI